MTATHGRVLTDEERARAVREQLKSLHAFDLAYEMMVGLVTFGYQKMGLTDATSELRDLGDARLTIELLRANLGVWSVSSGAADTRDLHVHAGADAARVRAGAGARGPPAGGA